MALGLCFFITLREVSQVQKAEYHMFSFICAIQTQYKYNNVMKHRSHKGEITIRRGRVKEGR
jgi:hypothetical protein